MFSFFYQIGLHGLALASLPKLFFQRRKYQSLLSKRLGKNFPAIKKGEKKLLWIHAVSLGETRAIAPLVNQIKQHHPEWLILHSTVTQTGHEEGKKSLAQADYHVYLPFDFSYIIKPIIKRTQPDVVMITETDFWYNFQQAAKKCGANLILINGKLSEKSMKYYQRFPFVRSLVKTIDHFCLQGELYKNRFESIGIPSHQITVTGNIKLDSINQILSDDEKTALRQKLGLDPNSFVLTLGSTHAPEERIWLNVLKKIWLDFPQLRVLLVPRHPDRFNEVAQLIEKEGIDFQRYSQSQKSSKPITLIDTMGFLKNCYQISDIAFVGGSFTEKVGGHNILEPSFYGVPVLYGPHMHSQPDLVDLMKNYRAGIQVSETDLFNVLQDLLSDPQKRNDLGLQGLKLTTEAKGALNNTLKAIASFLD